MYNRSFETKQDAQWGFGVSLTPKSLRLQIGVGAFMSGASISVCNWDRVVPGPELCELNMLNPISTYTAGAPVDWTLLGGAGDLVSRF